jgi:hypothetical protein
MPESGAEATTPRPTFFRITIGLLVLLSVVGVAIVAFLALNVAEINRSGGWGWIMGAAVFVAALILVSGGCAVSSALSLWRHEAHRGLSSAILVGSCLVLLAFVPNLVRAGLSQFQQYNGASRASRPTRQSERAAVRGSEIPDSLVQHFKRHGISLSRAQPGTWNHEWLVENVEVGARCEVVTSFRGFARALPVELATKELAKVSTPSVLNEPAMLAMFHPHARGKTADVRDCDEWPAKSAEITARVVEVFKSYRP